MGKVCLWKEMVKEKVDNGNVREKGKGRKRLGKSGKRKEGERNKGKVW